ncbi:hypothetical protein XENOCAPTIV_024732 [Xenoophorus captivus]|uniref:Secreted protein n=1 Tax=Xenoophorus captivus TaxID=1517983 RepID=A0ABV0SAI5_9TELE
MMLLFLRMPSDAWVFLVRALSLGVITVQTTPPLRDAGGTNEMPVAARSDQSDCGEGEDGPQQDWWRPAGQKVALLQTDLNTSQGRLSESQQK